MTRESTQKGRFRCVVESLRLVVTLLLMIVVGVSGVKAQVGTDYSGTYYISSNNKGSRGGTTAARFYLCPSTNMYLANQPFVTTKKTNQGTDSKWILNFVETIDGKDYYHVIHVAKDANDVNMYLTYNEEKVSGNDARVRVHLQESLDETEGHEDYNLFYINAGNVDGSVVICPKGDEESYSGNTIRSLNPAKNNVDNYAGNNANSPGSFSGYDGNTINCGGLIGLWLYTDNNSTWFLEDYITRPTIGYDASGNIKITNNVASATVYYTTDGTDPITSATRETGTNETILTSFTDGDIIKAVAKVGDEYSNVVTFTAVVHVGSSNQYLIQNLERTDFYMIPGDVNSGNTTVNTTSLPQAGMSWYFEYAGSSGGVQYYYFINGSTGDYLFNTGNNVYMKTNSVFDAAADKTGYMFTTVQGYDDENNPDGFHIVPKAQISDNTYCIYKGGWSSTTTIANASADAMKGSTNARRPEHKHTRWNLLLENNPSFPSPITVSDNNSTTYYTFTSSNANTYRITTPTATYVTTSTGESDSQKWYFEDAGSDGWASYYYIINAMTGEAIYFNGTESSSNQSDALTMSALPANPNDNYRFALAKTTEDGKYYIISKPLAQFTKSKYTAVWRENTGALQTRTDRASEKIKWYISKADFCMPSVFTEAGGNITLSCPTNGAEIHYTEDGSTPDANSTNVVTVNTSWTSSTQHVIKAKAFVKDGETVTASSEAITLLNKPDITLEENQVEVNGETYTYSGTTKTPVVAQVSIGSGTNMVTAPTSPETYSVTYSDNTNAGTATVNVNDANANDTWYILNATKTFTINRAEATVKADYKTKVYQTTPSADPALTATVTGMVNNEPETLITYTLSRVAGESVGSYTITPSGDEIQGNYQVTYETGVFQIGYEIHPTVTLDNWVYGEPNEPSVTDGGAGAVTYYYKTKDAADDTYTEEQPVNVGNYTIKAEVAATEEYFAASATKDFSITKRSLTVKANAITKDYLDEDPELTFTVTGIQYNEDKNTVLFCELQRAEGEAKGEYAITSKSLTLLSTQNYSTPSFTGATFTIKAKSLGDGGDPAPGISIYAKDNPWTVSVYTGKTPFTKGTDYTVSEKGDPDENGNYTITVTAVEGSNCTGAAKATYSANSKFYAVNGTTEKFTPYISTTSDMTTSSDLVPYIVTQVNSTIGTISIVPVSYIPKDEPVLLLAQSDVTGITTSPKNAATTPISESLISNNKLNIAPEGGVQVKATEAYIFYSYNENDKDIGEFVLTTAGTIKKGRYFLYNPKYQEPADPGTPTPAPARSLAIVKGDATGIIQLTNDEVREGINDVWYSIEGQKLSKKPTRKGLYIQNGKKLIVK